jgi:hypothetical protein
VVKEREKAKYRVKDIITAMQKEGYPKFKQHQHTLLWKAEQAKTPGKGYGVTVGETWYWYDSWLNYVRQHCDASENQYR